jgi:hypothetical protein
MEPVEEKASRFLLDTHDTHVILCWLFDDPKLSDLSHHVIEDTDNTKGLNPGMLQNQAV